MKSNHVWALFKLETAYFSRFFFFPVIFAGEIVMFSMLEIGWVPLIGVLWIFGSISIFWSHGFLFQNGTFGFDRPAMCQRTSEFYFSRAFNRLVLFGIDAFLSIASSSIPMLTLVGCSLWHPNLNIPLPSPSNPTTPLIRAFYFSHFAGASVVGSGKTASIVVPHGEVTFALMALGVVLAGAALYQAIMLGTLRFRWFQRSFPIVSIFVAPAVLFGWFFYAVHRWQHSGTPRQYPTALPPSDWIIAALTAHPLRLVILGLAVIASALSFSCRRFINQEVLS